MKEPTLIRDAEALRAWDPSPFRRPARAKGVLLGSPDAFQVLEEHNVHMGGKLGSVDSDAAARQFEELAAVYRSIGLETHALSADPNLPDLVFSANPSLAGVDRAGETFAILSRMRHESRRPETAVHALWYEQQGIRVVSFPSELAGSWEGGGDNLWHPGRYQLWSGVGPRTDERLLSWVSAELSIPTVVLALENPEFYHLDTCLAMIDEETAAFVPQAFHPDGVEMIRAGFPKAIELDTAEARHGFAGNLYCPDGRNLLLPAGAPDSRRRLTEAGLAVQEIGTGEFLKSGGSIYCMKQEIPSGS